MVIDVDKIICELEEKGLKISDKEKLTYYIKNFNVNTFLADYSDFFINEQGNFDQGVNSEDIIRLYIFDKNLGVHVFKCLLIIEKMINTSLVYATINVYDIKDKCLLNLDENVIKNDVLRNLDKVEPYTEFKPFLYKYTKYLDSNKNIKKLVIKDEPDNIYK
jgi:abortive infection bacteriophage resistance protein